MAKKGRVGALSVSLSLNSAQFSTALKNARKRVGRFGKSIAAGTFRLAKYGAALGAAGVAIGAYYTRQSMKAIDETAKWSDRLGIATEALTGLQHAAVLTGVSARQLQTGLQRMTRRISEASVGTGEARGVLAELGLEAMKLVKLSPDKQFMAIAKAMKQTKLQGDRVRQTVKIFDMEAAGLVNTLALGEAQIEATIREADKLGIAFTRIDAKKVEMANDAIARLKGVFRGVGNVLAIKVAPVVTRIVEKFIAVGTEGEGAGVKIEKAFDRVVKLIEAIGDGIDDMIYAWHTFTLMIDVAAKKLATIIKWWAKIGRWQPTVAIARGVTLGKVDPLAKVVRAMEAWEGGLEWDIKRRQKLLEDVMYQRIRGGGAGAAVRSITTGPAAAPGAAPAAVLPAPVTPARGERGITREQGMLIIQNLEALRFEMGRSGVLG